MATPPAPAAREHLLSIRKVWFDLVGRGLKTVEVRVGHPKIRRIAPGDLLYLTADHATRRTRVVRVAAYASFAELLDAEDPAAVGGPGADREAVLSALREIYPPEKEALGVYALQLSRDGD
ncbi:ASCH domain-containing protein [Streptomyces sp. MS19]|uniref:ASCH domain-containing protein n=1 Tax=Streptomyces sp. MS19 TaxID=3385972 RepID=UPI00399F3C40